MVLAAVHDDTVSPEDLALLRAKRASQAGMVFVLDPKALRQKQSYRQRLWRIQTDIYNFLEHPKGTLAFLYHLAIFVYIVVVHSLSALAHIPENQEWIGQTTHYMELSLAIYFTVEFVVRLWSISADAKYSGYRGFMRYMRRTVCLIDVLILCVTIFILLAHNGNFQTATMEKIQFLQILRLLHIDRQMTTWSIIKKMISRSFEELVTIYWVSGLFFVFLALVVYEVETFAEATARARNETVEPTFNHYGDAFWFSIISVLTVGYGDVVVRHWLAKILFGVMIFFGVSMFTAASSLVGVGMSLMVENETKMQQQNKIRQLAAKLIQTWYRFSLLSDENRFAEFEKFHVFCNNLHHVEERIKAARSIVKRVSEKRQAKTRKFSTFKRQSSFQEKHSQSYTDSAIELGISTVVHNAPIIRQASVISSSKVQDLLGERYRPLQRKTSSVDVPRELPPRHPNWRRSSVFSLQSRSSLPSPKEPTRSITRDGNNSSSSFASDSVDFSDEEKLLDYYYDPYKADSASIGKKSQDTNISALDDDTISRYRQVLRMLHYFMFLTTKKKFNRARKPYELLDADNELCEMEYQRLQKLKELELRVQATVGKPTISPFYRGDDHDVKLSIEDRLQLCEEQLRMIELKSNLVTNLAEQILQQVNNSSPRAGPKPSPKAMFLKPQASPDETKTLQKKVREAQRRRVLFKEHSIG